MLYQYIVIFELASQVPYQYINIKFIMYQYDAQPVSWRITTYWPGIQEFTCG